MLRSRVVVCLLSTLTAAQQYIVSTVAGGVAQTSPAVGNSVSLSMAFGLATDAAGNVYFSAAYCVFKLDPNGIMTRIAGTGKPGYSGDGEGRPDHWLV